MKKLYTLFIISFLVCFNLRAQTYIVDLGGGGDFLTIQACADSAIAGCTCLVSDGTYNEYVTVTNTGVSGNPIIFQAINADSVSMQGFFVFRKDFIEIRGFEITNTPSANHAIVLDSSQGSKVINNYIHNTTGTNPVTGAGIYLAGSHRVIIDSNTIMYTSASSIRFNTGSRLSNWVTISNNTMSYSGYLTGGASIMGGNGNYMLIENNDMSHAADFVFMFGDYNVVRNNKFHDVTALEFNNGPHIDGVQSYGRHILVEGNYMYNVAETGGNVHFALFADAFTTDNYHCVIRHNTVNGIDGGFLIIQGNFEDAKLYNNTVVKTNRNTGAFSTTIGFAQASDSSSTFNNLFHTAVGVGNELYFYHTVALPGAQVDYNLAWSSVCQTTCTGWNNGNIIPTGTDANGIYNVDPNFTVYTDDANFLNDDFNLNSSSVAINSGTSLTNVKVTDAGTGLILKVDDADFFQYGTTIVNADWIAIGNVLNIVQIDSIDYTSNTIILVNTVTRTANDKVWLFKNSSGEQVLYGTAPDIGAYEYGSVTGLTDVTKSETDFLLYPNPTSGIITLQLSKATQGELTIYNSIGSVIYQEFIKNETAKIDLGGQNSGIYFITFETNKGITTKKAVVFK